MEERIKALETDLENLKVKWRESQKVEFTPGEKVLFGHRVVTFLLPVTYNTQDGQECCDPAGCLIYCSESDIRAHGVRGIEWTQLHTLKKI